jgi:hypothetical protein
MECPLHTLRNIAQSALRNGPINFVEQYFSHGRGRQCAAPKHTEVATLREESKNSGTCTGSIAGDLTT